MKFPKLIRARYLAPLAAAVVAAALYSSCGDGAEFNLFQPIAQPLAANDQKAQLEQARVLMDQKKYDEAVDVLEPVIDDDPDSNEAYLLYAAAKLGVAELDVWSIISDVLEAQEKSSSKKSTATASSSSSKSSGGLDELLDSLGDSVLGTGTERTAKVEALIDAITTLRAAPDPDKKDVQNTACLLAGILAVPTVASAKSSLDDATTALQTIKTSASDGGQTCPDITALDDAAAGVSAAAAAFNLILQVASSCPFLDLEETQATMNAVQTQMSLLTENADKGCDSLPTCPAALPDCQSLFPTCVQQALAVGTSSAKAGDGTISSCELVLNCTVTGGCFK